MLFFNMQPALVVTFECSYAGLYESLGIKSFNSNFYHVSKETELKILLTKD